MPGDIYARARDFLFLFFVCIEKNLIFFGPFPYLFHPLCTHSLPESKTIFFHFQKKTHEKENQCQNNLKTRRGKHRNVFSRRVEGHQTGSVLVRGLPYISSRHETQRSLQKVSSRTRVARRRVTQKLVCSSLCFESLLQDRPFAGPPGGGKRFEKGTVVQPISRVH